MPEPDQVLLTAVLDHYIHNHAATLPSHSSARHAVALLDEWLFEVKKLKETAKANVFGLDYQEEFVRWCAVKNHSAKYISRNLSTIASAMHYSANEQAITDDEEGRRIVHLMSTAPKVRYDPKWIAEVADIDAPQRRRWVPTLEQMGGFIDCIRSEHVFRYTILALNTWARAEAIMELDLNAQVDIDAGLVDLNPPGRRQNEKRRPIIRLTKNLEAWRNTWQTPRPIIYRGAPINNVKRAVQRTNIRWMMVDAGLDPERIEHLMSNGAAQERKDQIKQLEEDGANRITRRVMRAFMATRIRSQREVQVDREQRQVWLGHNDQDTTSNYEVMDPDYLREASQATDHIINKIDGFTSKNLWPKR